MGSDCELALTSGGAIDLSQVDPLGATNTIGTVASLQTAASSSFDLVNGQSLTVGPLGSLAGITTNDGNVVLQTLNAGSNITIDGPIDTNNGTGSLTGAFAQIGLSATGTIGETSSVGQLVAPSVEVVAGGTADLSSGLDVVQTFAGQIAGAGSSGSGLTLLSNNDLTIDTLQISAGPLSLPTVQGVTTNNGTIDLETIGALTLNQSVNSNNGLTTLAPKTAPVVLRSLLSGDITQSTSSGNNGIIIGGALVAEADNGNVVLTAANHIGANDNGSGIAGTPGTVAGAAAGSFSLVNTNAGITVDLVTLGCGSSEGGIETSPLTGFASHDINLATVVTGNVAGAGNITINQPLLAPRGGINVAVAPNSTFTNNSTGGLSFFDTASAGLDTSFRGGSVVILADNMSLAGGTILTGSNVATAGAVVLAPATPTRGIAIGGSDPSTLNLAQGDIDSITAGFLQFGYKADGTGTSSYTGTVNPGTIAINTDQLAALLLVTGGQVSQAATDAISYTGKNPLQLGVLAGDTVALLGNNSVPTLARYDDGAGKSFTFVNNNTPGNLTVGSISRSQLALTIDGTTGLPTPSVAGGAAPNPLTGITTNNGDVTLKAFAGGTLTLATPVNAGTGTVTLFSSGTTTQSSGAIITAGTLSSEATADVTLTEQNQVAALNLIASNGLNAFTFTNARDLSITGTGVTSWQTITLNVTGNLTIGAPLATLAPGDSIALNIAGSISEPTGGSITTTALTGSSVGGATLGGDNAVGNIAAGGWSDTGAGSAGFILHNTQNLTIGGTISSASGPITLTTPAALNLAGDLSASAGTVTLGRSAITQASGTINASNLIATTRLDSGGAISLTNTSSLIR